jgi:DNA mismatch repair ATPase MutS
MLVKNLISNYNDRINLLKLKEDKIKKLLILISVLRFLFFIFFIASIVYVVKQFSVARLILIITVFFSFISLVILYIKKTDILIHTRNLLKINTDEIKSLNGQYTEFYCGDKYINREHEYSFDLDLFGEGSFYQYVNRTTTQVGQDLLAKKLLNTTTSADVITGKQKVITELSEKIDWRQNFLATGYACPVTNENSDQIDDWIDKPVYFVKRKVFRILVVALPVITLGTLFLLIAGKVHYSIFTLLALSQLFIASFFLRSTNQEQNNISKRIGILKNYSRLIKLIENEKFSAEILVQLKNDLYTGSHNANDAFKLLIRIIDAFDTRLNIFLGAILNATLMWDLYSVIRLERWKLKYGKNVKLWVKVIAEYDAYCSLANFAYNNPDYIYPKFTDKKVIHAKDLGHPLIPRTKRINNDFEVSSLGKIDIITGANMAGKSTFLRTIGINVLLAHCGMPVCATKYEFKIIDLFSGMRTADSLKENESYFYAELKRLKYSIDRLKQGKPILILLDEILKGTNSIDKAKGSWKFVEHLIHLNATGVVATHDLTLCDIEKNYPDNITNKCFEVEIDGQNISFDYKLKSGVTKNMNASILMKQMGLFK